MAKKGAENAKIDKLLIDNFVNLQKVLTNLCGKFDVLSDRISQSLEKEESVKKRELEREKLDKILVDNFVNLQKVLTNLCGKFDVLSDRISKLLELFEISAKSFVEKQNSRVETEARTAPTGGKREFSKKVDALLEQNKTIAKGLTLIEEKLREKHYGAPTDREVRERPRYPNM